MENLYTNRNSKKDFVRTGIDVHAENEMNIFIASAFFTDMTVIKMFLSKQCHIRIIVRLGFPTSSNALEKLLECSDVEVRFFTSHSFHPKIYLFGDKYALVGSANLTRYGVNTNQEVVVGIDSNDDVFYELTQLFSEYWEEAEVLTQESLSSYKEIYEEFKANSLVNAFDKSVIDKIGDISFSNISRGKKKKSKKSIFISTYKKSYQETVTAFNKIQELYNKKDRKVNENAIPLRLEVDSFFSFVRKHHATHEIWKEEPLGWNNQKQLQVNTLIDEWLSMENLHFEEEIVTQSYPLIKEVFNSIDSIENSSDKEIIEALVVLHSFHDRLRFYKGGIETLKNVFKESNDIEHVKYCFKHLLHGEGDIVNRMADLIYDPSFNINEFGKANIQEMVGWINNENLPIINGRTTKILRYFGFNVSQL